MKDLCFLVSYPTRFIFGSLYGSSKQQKNIVQLCTICFPTIEREKGLHRLEVDILISVYTKHIMPASETQKEPCHKPLSSRSRSLKAHQEYVKKKFAVWPGVVFEARLLISQKRSSMETVLLPNWAGWGRWQSKQLFGKNIVNIVVDNWSKVWEEDRDAARRGGRTHPCGDGTKVR